MSKKTQWQNNVAEIVTIREDTGKGIRETKKLIVRKDFDGKFKNSLNLKRHSTLLEECLKAGVITQESFDKQMKYDISNVDNFELQVGKPIKFVSHLVTAPPQLDKGSVKPLERNEKGYINKVLDVKINKDGNPYITLNTDLSLKKGNEVRLNDVEQSIRNNKNLTQEEKEEKLDKLRMEGSNQLWLKYTGCIEPDKS